MTSRPPVLSMPVPCQEIRMHESSPRTMRPIHFMPTHLHTFESAPSSQPAYQRTALCAHPACYPRISSTWTADHLASRREPTYIVRHLSREPPVASVRFPIGLRIDITGAFVGGLAVMCMMGPKGSADRPNRDMEDGCVVGTARWWPW